MTETGLIINDATARLSEKLKELNPQLLNISEYNKKYLLRYINNYNFYMSLYKQLLIKAVSKLPRPVSESIFIDYGGGCGILSFLAKEAGFKTVVYNDIYSVSATDAQAIASQLNVHIDNYITGDIETFVNEINRLNIKPDLICSFDVLEHIYNWRSWIKIITKINNPFSLLFMTSANSKNPFINYRLKKIQRTAEYKGFPEKEGWKESDLSTSFLEERKKIIATKFSHLTIEEVNRLAKISRGLIKEDIENLVNDFLLTGKITYQPTHPTNTCDPYTGNWAENLINTNELKDAASDNNLTIEITNSYYGYSNNNFLDFPKYLMNLMIKLTGKNNLFFSPMYVLEITKNKEMNSKV
jgi:2-polyprenyl-3-methyl-5-hydroxy-6-metoxy-1,4-benzoquinol methylase